MSECTGWKLARGSRRVGALTFLLSVAIVGFVLVGTPVALSASDVPPPAPASGGAEWVDDLAVARALTMAFKFDEAQAALDRLAGQYVDDPIASAKIAEEVWWLGIKRRMTRAESLAKPGRNVETEVIYRGILADAAALGTVSPDADVAYLARSKARKDLMFLYLNWGRAGEIDLLWADFAADRGPNQASYALKMGEEFREAGECARSMAAYDLAAEGYSTATSEADVKAFREARIGAVAAGCLVAGSGKSVNDIAAVAAQASAGAERAEVYQRAIKFLLQMKAPERILALSQCAPDSAGRAVCRVRGLMATGQFDRATSESLQALAAMPEDKSAAGVVAFALQKMCASAPGDLERGRAFFAEASSLVQGEAAIRVRGGWALFLARVASETTTTLAVLDDIMARFPDRRAAAIREIDRVAGEWEKQVAYGLQAAAHERLSPLTQGSASLGHRRDAVKSRVMADATSATLAERLSSLSEAESPAKNDALLEACEDLIGGGRADLVRTACEAVLSNSPSAEQSESAHVTLARLELMSTAAQAGGEELAADMPSTRTLRVAPYAMSRGEYEAARALWHRALADFPDNREARLGLIEATLSCGNGDEALSVAASLSASDPDPIYGLWIAALNASSRGHAETAAVFADGLASLGFVNSVLLAQTCRAIHSLRTGAEPDTTALRQALLALPGEGHETAAMVALADALRVARRCAEARELYNRATALTLGGAPSIWSRAATAVLEAEEGSLTTAPLDAVSASLSNCIGSVAMSIAQGYCYPALGETGPFGPTPENYRRKLQGFEMLARRCADSDFLMPRVLLGLGEAHKGLGSPDRAEEYYALLLRRYPNYQYTPVAASSIAGIRAARAAELERAGDQDGYRAALQSAIAAADRCARSYPDTNTGVSCARQASDWRARLGAVE